MDLEVSLALCHPPLWEQAQKYRSLVGANLLQSSHTALEQKAESEKGGMQVNMFFFFNGEKPAHDFLLELGS